MLNKLIIIKNLIALFLVIGQGFFCFAQSESYFFNEENSQITFQIKHLGLLTVNGTFKNFSGTLILKNDKLEAIESVIKVNSINTDDESRDNTLVSEAYLNTNDYPNITFFSTSNQEKLESNIVEGILKIKDVEKKIETSYFLTKDGNQSTLKIYAILSRKDFQLNFGSMNALIGDQIKVEIIINKLKN